MKRCALSLIAIAALLPVVVPAAQKIVVPKDVRSIQAGLDKAEPGDTVCVLNGTYRESIVLRDDISLIGESMDKTIIHGNRSKPVVRGGNNSLIRNFTIENGGKGIMCENTSTVIEHDIIRNNKGSGIQCLISLPTIRNNIICRNEESGIYCESARSLKTLIDHNVVAENGYCGLMLAGRSEVLVEDNVFYMNKQYGIWANEDSKKSRIVYNDFFGNRTPYNFFAQIDKSNIADDPAYPAVSAAAYDYAGSQPEILKGRGKGGISIGLVSDAEMLQIQKNNDSNNASGR